VNQTNGLKILALVISIILWAYVRVTQGGVTHTSQTQLELRVPLETKGGGSNLIPFEKSTDTISLVLRGDSEVVTELREGLVRAYVELEGMAPGSNWPEVQVLVPAGVQILSVDPSSVNVHLSPLMVKEVPIKIATAGAPKKGFVVGAPIYQPQSVKLEGPEELVSQVNMVMGVVPVDGLGETLALTVNNLVPLNENETAVMGTDTALRLAVREVRVTIPIEQELTLETLPVALKNVKVVKQTGYEYELDVSPEFVQISTALTAEKLPESLQVKPYTFEPTGAGTQEVEVEIETVPGLTLVGGSKVTLTLKPEKIETSED
jgi:YbbR domain-containing protein